MKRQKVEWVPRFEYFQIYGYERFKLRKPLTTTWYNITTTVYVDEVNSPTLQLFSMLISNIEHC